MSTNIQVWCHPDVMATVRASVTESVASGHAGPLFAYYGLEFRTSPFMPRTRKRWVPPVGPFWEYEDADSEWCEPLGIGTYVDEPVVMLVHPEPRILRR